MLGNRRLWAIALIILAGVGLLAGSRQFVLFAPRVSDPDVSLRAVATQHLEVPDALEQLRTVLKTLPHANDVIIFGSSTDWGSAEIYMLTSYLHWPHKVWFVQTGGPSNAPAPPAAPESAKINSALFFYAIEPPPDFTEKAKKIGSKLTIVTDRTGLPR
jgi:hypothetical protein